MIVVSAIWGFAGPVIKFSLHDFPPLVFLSYRFAISTIVALIYFSFTQPPLPKKQETISTILLYSLLAVPIGLGLLFFGFEKTTSLTGTLLSATAPIAVVIASAEFLREHVTQTERFGIILAFLGTVMTVMGPLVTSHGFAFGAFEGNLLIMASIAVDTIATILVKILMRSRVSPTLLSHVSFIIGFLVIFPIMLWYYSPSEIFNIIRSAPLSAHLGVWYMALLSGSLAYGLRNEAVKSIEVSETAVFSYLYPLWAAPLSIFWLSEKITAPFIVGAGVITVGVIIAEYKRSTRIHHHHRQKRR
ncbi:EamA family transporter [Candidatus Gottesmanbacteria bacterium]|nr:EamA family transporter [Candidatus Gottesmanbacteria bacterium]